MSRPLIPSAAGLRELVGRFDTFIVDQFGVLHNGSAPYEGAVEALELLRDAGKQILLLSNSGKRSKPNEDRLVRLGFSRGSWQHFLSSGEVAWGILRRSLNAQHSLRCLLIARDNDRSAVEGLPLTITDSGQDADVVLISGSEGDRFELGHYEQLLKPAAARGTRCICTNPDQIMLTSVGPRFGAGCIAAAYEKLGGKVTWIGKPFPEIYEAALTLLGNPNPDRVVCVGDSIEHDIAGGQSSGLSTALVGTGVFAASEVAEVGSLQRRDVVPDFFLSSFQW